MSTVGRRRPRRFEMRVQVPLAVDSAAGSAQVSQAQGHSGRGKRAGAAFSTLASLTANLPSGKGLREAPRLG